MAQKQSLIMSENSVNMCSLCGRDFDPAVEQAYELDGAIVCATCVAAMEAEQSQPAMAPADDLAALAGAGSAGRARAGAASRRVKLPPKKKQKSAAPAIAGLIGLLAVCGVSAWFYSTGRLDKWMHDTKSEVTGVASDNEQAAKYSALVETANDQAKAKQYAQAAATLREAKKVLETNPRLTQTDPKALPEVNAGIAKYESMADRNAATPKGE